jgi:RNA polymerase sigma-70 factor, ECF subfamily
VNTLATTVLPEASEEAGARFDSLFRTHYRRVARVIGRIIHDESRAEEIAVDVFVKWRRHPAAHGTGAEGWLYRTAVRQALDAGRRDTRWYRVRRVLAYVSDLPPTPEELHTHHVERRQVHAVLRSLRRRDVEVLLLWAEDLSHAEIAAAVSVQPSSVGSLLRRAQEKFRTKYEAKYGKQS